MNIWCLVSEFILQMKMCKVCFRVTIAKMKAYVKIYATYKMCRKMCRKYTTLENEIISVQIKYKNV